jgi:hypothetical protein
VNELSEVLGLEVISSEPGRHVFFRCGQGVVLVFNPERTESEPSEVNGSPIPRMDAGVQGISPLGGGEKICRRGKIISREPVCRSNPKLRGRKAGARYISETRPGIV